MRVVPSAWYEGPVPGGHGAQGLVFVPLSAVLAEDDYRAFMPSRARLRLWSRSDWPSDSFSLEDNIRDLRRHDDEHQRRIAFTYSVKELVSDAVIGCLYLLPFALAFRGEPPATTDHGPAPGDVVARGWLRDGLDEARLIAVTAEWIRADWTFPAFWWQSNSLVPDQGASCEELGLTRRLSWQGWELRTWPSPA